MSHRNAGSRCDRLMSSGQVLAAFCLGCGGPVPLTVDMTLHLEDHVDVAAIVGSALPANPAQPVEWRFDEPQPDWKPTPHWIPPFDVPHADTDRRGAAGYPRGAAPVGPGGSA